MSEATTEPIENIAHTSAWRRFSRKWKRLNRKGVFEVERILGTKHGEEDSEQYVYVQWAGMPLSKAEWIPESDLM